MTDAELAILGIISEKPISGRDLHNTITERNLRLWTRIGVESVNYVVQKLQKQGLIEAFQKQRAANVSQEYFRVTAAGIGVLQTAVTNLLSTLRQFPNGFDLGLANLHSLKDSQIQHALLSYRSSIEERRELMDSQLSELRADDDIPIQVLAMFERQIALLDAEHQWLQTWIEQWQAQATFKDDHIPKWSDESARMRQRIMPEDSDSFHKLDTQRGKRDDLNATRFSQSTPPRLPKNTDEDTEC